MTRRGDLAGGDLGERAGGDMGGSGAGGFLRLPLIVWAGVPAAADGARFKLISSLADASMRRIS